MSEQCDWGTSFVMSKRVLLYRTITYTERIAISLTVEGKEPNISMPSGLAWNEQPKEVCVARVRPLLRSEQILSHDIRRRPSLAVLVFPKREDEAI